MALKFSIQGILIYLTMLVFLVALFVRLTGRKRLGMTIYGVAFAVALGSWGFRWWRVGHLPMSNLFEVFLFLAMLMFPLSVFCRRFLGTGGSTPDILIAIVFLMPAGFVLDATPAKLIPALRSPLFAPHVATYLLAYVIMAKATVQAVGCLLRGDSPPQGGLISYELGTYRLVCLAFPLLTAGLVLGAVWGKLAWGDYWNWDPKELWSLASWLVYVGYLHFRAMHGPKHPGINAALALVGMATIVITLLWVNLSRLFAGLHSYA